MPSPPACLQDMNERFDAPDEFYFDNLSALPKAA